MSRLQRPAGASVVVTFFAIGLAMTGVLVWGSAAQALTVNWQAGGDLLWSNSANWDLGLPGAADTANFTGANLGAVDLGGATQTISGLTVSNLGYSFTNGTLALNTVTTAVDGRPAYLNISANVTDAGGNGLTIKKHNGDGGYINISGQITVSSTAANAFYIAPISSTYGSLIFGSTTATNSVAGGVLIADWSGGSSEDFKGTWTIGGDFNVARASGGRNDVSMNTVRLLNTVSVGGNLQNASLCGNAGSLQIAAGSAVSVTGNLIVAGKSTNDISINQALAKLGGSVNVLSGTLKLNVTDPILDGSGVANTSKVFLLGDTSDANPATISINTNAKTLNNPIAVQAGGSGQAIIASGATGTGLANKVTYAGAITLGQGLSINASNTAGAMLDIAGKISGSQFVALNNGTFAGTVMLSNPANDYSGGTFVNSGVLQVNIPTALGGAGRNVTLNGPASVALGYATTSDLFARLAATSTGTAALTAASVESIDFTGLPMLSLGATGAYAYNGTLTPDGATYRLGGGGGTLTFTPMAYTPGNDLVLFGNVNTGTVDFGGIANTKSFGAVTIAGGTVQNGTLTGASFNVQAGTVSGATVLDGIGAAMTKAGTGTTTLSGSAVHTFTGGLTINAGTLAETFANLTATPNENLVNSGNVLTLGGGTLSLTGRNNVPSSQAFASTTLSANRPGKITLARTGTGTMTVALNAITRNTGSTLNFTNVPDTSTIIATTSNLNDASGILGPWATVGVGTGNSGAPVFYATVNGSGQIVSYAGATALTDLVAFSDMNSATTNYTLNAAAATTVNPTAPITGNTLRLTGAAALTINTNGNNITLNGILDAATNAYNNVTIARTGTPAAGNLMIGANRDLVLISGGKQAINISAPIVDYDGGAGPVASAVTYGGFVDDNDFALNLNSANTYSGGTTVNSGRLKIANLTALGTGPVTVNNGARLMNTLGSSPGPANALTLNGGILDAGNGGWSGPITLAANSFMGTGDFHGTPWGSQITGNISGPGGFTTNTNSLMFLTGTNSYAGPTNITAGGVQFKGPASLYNADPTKWIPANISVNSGCTLGLSIGGAGEFTGDQAGTIITNLTSNINNNGLKAGSTVLLDPFSAGGTPVEISAAITDSVGPGGGQVNLWVGQHDGGTPQTVILSGANTYSGTTKIDRYRGTTLVVSSFNSVFTNPALGTVHSPSSSLGAPTTVANGTISFGNGGDNTPEGLKYVGAGETTDRVLANTGGGGSTITLDQAGSGLLKFVSATAGNSFNLVLQGSTAGTGEFAGRITAGSLAKNGTGLWTLSGANTYTGATTVNAGALKIANAAALGTTAGGTTVNANAALQVEGGITVGNEALSLNGTGVSNDGALRNVSGANVWQGAVTLAGATRINSDAGSLTFNTAANSITGTARNLTLGGAGDGAVAGTITTTSGTLTKDGAGVWTLSGANGYTGTTTVNEGTLAFATRAALYNTDPASWTSAKIVVASGATLSVGVGEYFSGYFSAADIDTLLDGAHLGASTDTTGLKNGASIGLDTTNAGSFSYSTAIGNLFGGANSLGVTKRGSGTLTLLGVNTYTGPTTLVAGALNLGVAEAVGVSGPIGPSGAIVFAGGALQYSPVNNYDYSPRFSMAAGQAYNVDTNGRDATWAAPLTSAGGSLAKSGLGTLTLTGVNSYNGPTAVSNGSLLLGPGASMGPTAVAVTNGATYGLNQTSNGLIAAGDALSMANGKTLEMRDGAFNTMAFGGSGLLGVDAGSTVSLNMDLGATAGQYDKVSFGGSAALAGRLNFSFNTFGGLENGAYLVLNSALGISGDFTPYLLGDSVRYGHNLALELNAERTAVVLNVTGGAVAVGSYWAPAAGGGGSGTWTAASTTWAASAGSIGPGTLPQSNVDALVFTNAAGTVTINGGGVSATGLTFDTAGYTIAAATSADTLTLTGAATVTANQDAAISAVISGNAGLAKAGAGTLTLTAANNYTGMTTVSGGTLQVGNGGSGAALGAGGVQLSNSAKLLVNHADTVALDQYVGGAGSLTKSGTGKLTLNNFGITGQTILAAGTLELGPDAHFPVLAGAGADIQQGKIVFDGGDAATIQSLLTASYNTLAGKWQGGQFKSTTAPTTGLTLGWKDNVTDITVMATYAGDANLDGSVDGIDLDVWKANVGSSTATFAMADLNYDGSVDGLDLDLWKATVGSSGAGGAGAASAPVPEPGTFVLLAMGLLGLLAWRRRS